MSNRTTLHIKKAGLLTTIQDSGREGFRHLGVPPGGWLDEKAAQNANALVGNPPETPVLEITMSGPIIKVVEGRCIISITGADISPVVDNNPVPINKRIEIHPGQVLSFGRLINGCRAYLAVHGEWNVARWLGSASAFLQDPTNILPQSVLGKGQTIEIHTDLKTQRATNPIHTIKQYVPPYRLRILPGPEYEWLGRVSVEGFLFGRHRASNSSSRMGIRLEDSIPGTISHKGLISSGIIPGTIQITRSGECIILLKDAQTTGGYPRIANVISADMDTLAQIKPGDEIRFEIVNQDYIRSLKS